MLGLRASLSSPLWVKSRYAGRPGAMSEAEGIADETGKKQTSPSGMSGVGALAEVDFGPGFFRV